MQQRSKTRRSWCWGWISPRPRGSSRSERSTRRRRRRVVQPTKKDRNASGGDKEPDFLGEPFNADEARTKWPQCYQRGPAKRSDEQQDVMARCQYRSAKVGDVVCVLRDNDYVMANYAMTGCKPVKSACSLA